jgi:hypothetical protein
MINGKALLDLKSVCKREILNCASMKTALVLCAVLFVLAMNNSHAEENSRSSNVYDVSLIQLIAAPDDYHGKLVRVRGFLNLEFEGDALYLHREDYEKMLTKNATAIIIKDSKLIRKFNKTYVLVEGLFCKMDGARYAWPWNGLIRNIRRVESSGGRDSWKPDETVKKQATDRGDTCP